MVNPTVATAFAANGRLAWRDVPAYMAAHLVGATAGALAIWLAFGQRAIDLGDGFGVAHWGPEVGLGQAAFAEALGAFILIFVVCGVALDARAPAGWAGLMIGMTLAVTSLTPAPVTGGAINPARVSVRFWSRRWREAPSTTGCSSRSTPSRR
jgi:glycerol uptake facilitator protein